LKSTNKRGTWWGEGALPSKRIGEHTGNKVKRGHFMNDLAGAAKFTQKRESSASKFKKKRGKKKKLTHPCRRRSLRRKRGEVKEESGTSQDRHKKKNGCEF